MTKPQTCESNDAARIRLDPGERNTQLRRFRTLMENMVVGQPGPIDAISNSFSRVLAGVGDPESPVLTLMLMGPTGVGKTETVRCLAESLFGSRKAYTRINCQEYSAHYNLSKLLGSPPGYVGGEIKPLLSQENLERHHKQAIEEGRGLFNEQLARLQRFAPDEGKNLSLILFDEIEKAHPKLWNLLLGILEDGTLVLTRSISPAPSSCSPPMWAAAAWARTSLTRTSASRADSKTSVWTRTCARAPCAKPRRSSRSSFSIASTTSSPTIR